MAAQFARAPHRGAPSGPVQTAPNAALLIDFDNVTMGIRSDLSKELKNLLNSDVIKGKVAVQRAYADWRRYPQYIVPLAEASVDLIFAPAYGSSKKNATDIRLAIDALELVFTRPEIGTFILLSGDSDFSSLVLKLKEYGKYVIGVGIRESASDLLVQNCDEYYSYSLLSGLMKEGEGTIEGMDPWTLAERSVRQMAEKGDIMRSDRLKQVMLELNPSFNEKDLGYSKFSKFLSDAVSRGSLHLRKVDNGQWEVAPVDGVVEAAAESRESRPQREDGRRSRGRGRDRDRGRPAEKREEAAPKAGAGPMEPVEAGAEVEARIAAGPEAEATHRATGGDAVAAAFELLCRAVANVASQGGAARDSDVKRRMLELEPGWDESTLGFSKFSRFLRQAHDAEVINLQKAGNGIYEVALPGGGAARAADDRRGRKERTTPAERKEEPKAAERKEEPAEPRPAERGPEPEAKAKAEPEATAAQPAPGREPAVGAGARGALGIGFRRGTRGRGAPAGPPPLLPGQTVKLPETPNGKAESPQPTDATAGPGGRAEAGAAQATGTKAAADAKPAEKTSRRSRGRGRSKQAAGAAAPAAEAPAPPELVGLPTDADGVATYLSSRYKGVGQKTAEAVIEAFGAAGVFRALHGEPERVREALGGRRADSLLSAWRSDLAQRRTEAAAVVQEAERAAEAKAAGDDGAAPDGEGTKKGGRSRGRRGGRSRTGAKAKAGES